MFLDLNPNLTSEQMALKEQMHKFAAEVMRPAADKLDKMADPADVIAEDSVLWDVIRQSRELGYHTRALPEELGGLVLSPVEQNIIGEEMGWGSAGLSVCMGAATMPYAFAAMFGTPELIEEHVIPFRDDTKGEYIGCWAITEPEQRRWLLPEEDLQEWEVPFDTDPDWPEALQVALEAYRAAWRGKMDEVNATIAASAPQETLYDQPKVVSNVLRVSGPFTIEGVQPAEETLDVESPIGGAPEELETFAAEDEPTNAEAYLEKMIRLLRQDGVRFPNNRVIQFERLEALPNSILHAEGEWGNGEGMRRVAVAFGPQYGPITARQVEQSLREAYRRGYDDMVFAGFTFDGAAQAAIQDDPDPRVRCHLAHIRPDVNMGDLLKDTPSSQLFTVFGLPRLELEDAGDGEWVVEMAGVDIYDPLSNTIRATKADKVAAWFLDSDYDGRTFCITQAFFPDSTAWSKLARALRSVVDPERFAAFAGTRSLPFQAGEHKRIAVKVIDPRGNEVMRVMHLEGVTYA